MATSQPDVIAMKDELNKITTKIDLNLYQQILTIECAPQNTIEEFRTAKLYYIDQLIENKLNPWKTAVCLRELHFIEIANKFEQFAIMFSFPRDPSSISTPETSTPSHKTSIMELLQHLKLQLTDAELSAIRHTKSKTFEEIFRELLEAGKLTPSLNELRSILQDEEREDLAAFVVIYSQKLTNMHTEKFNRSVHHCLDTMDTNIFSLLKDFKSSISKQHSMIHLLDDMKTSKLEKDYIDLTFTKEVDTRTLPLSEGSDAELQTLMSNNMHQNEKSARYIKALSEINTPNQNDQMICIVGHPGTGKTIFCNKIINQYANNETDAYRYVLLVACRNTEWHTLEDKFISTPGNKLDMIKLFLEFLIPKFSKQEKLAEIIINSEGKGLLLIIDSFDEFPQYQKFNSTLLFQLLTRNILNHCSLLITSRPGAWNQLLRDYSQDITFDHSWQVLGFSVEQRTSFISKMLTPGNAKTLEQVLKSKPELNLLTLVPVNISLIAGLVSSSLSISDLRTLTDVYTRLVLSTLDRQLKRFNKQSPGLISLQEIPLDIKNELMKLAELSYNGLINRKITFSATEISEIMHSSSKYSKGLGLLQIIRVTTSFNTVIDYLSCPHLTLQEYLAALHLAQKPTEEIISTIQEIFTANRWPAMKICVRFVCGLITEGQHSMINTIISKLHTKPAPANDCEFLNMHTSYTALHLRITAKQLSIIPYLLETEDPSILTSYYNTLSSTTSTCPHFYLYARISPVQLYSLCEYFSQLPAYSPIATLYICIQLLNTTQLLMLANSINTIQLHKLIVVLSGIDEARDISAMELLPNSIADISYELQHLHDTNRHTLIHEFQQFIYNNPSTHNIYKLKYILLTCKLKVKRLNLHTDPQLYNNLCTFVNNITHYASSCPPKQIYYKFVNLEFCNEATTEHLINIISPTATSLYFIDCYYSNEYVTRFISQSNVMYLGIFHNNMQYLQTLHNNLLAPDLVLMNVNKPTFKGITLSCQLVINETILCDFLQKQLSLEEITLADTSHPLKLLNAIQHLSCIKCLDIHHKAITQVYAEQCQTTYINITRRNYHTLSHVRFYPYSNTFSTRYADILSALSLCSNLQSIAFITCLTPQHMTPLATVINQLHKLVYLRMEINAITDEGVANFSQALSPNSNIRTLVLYQCKLTAASIPAIITIIHNCYFLQHLNLRNNSIARNTSNNLSELCYTRNIRLNI